jgi:hypothetical protein
MDTQQWADATVSVHKAAGRWEVRLWMGVRHRDDGSWPPGTWMALADFAVREEAEDYRGRAAQILENALRLSLPLVRDSTLTAKQFPPPRPTAPPPAG